MKRICVTKKCWKRKRKTYTGEEIRDFINLLCQLKVPSLPKTIILRPEYMRRLARTQGESDRVTGRIPFVYPVYKFPVKVTTRTTITDFEIEVRY